MLSLNVAHSGLVASLDVEVPPRLRLIGKGQREFLV